MGEWDLKIRRKEREDREYNKSEADSNELLL